MPSKHVLANREANSRHTYDVTIWLSRTTDNSNIFIRSHEVRDNKSRLYLLTNSANPDQLASESQLIWIFEPAIVCKGRAYLGSAGPGLIY